MSRPRKQIVPVGQGAAPKARRTSAGDPAQDRRCDTCGKTGPGRVRRLEGREAGWICPTCLEAAGQTNLLDPPS